MFAVILLPIRGIVKSQVYPNSTEYTAFGIDSLPKDLSPYNSILKFGGLEFPNSAVQANLWNIGYQPNNSDLVNNIMKKVAQDLRLNLYGK